MALAYINLSIKQYFNFMCKTDFERRIFHDSYKEFQKKARIYSLNQNLNTFSQMCQINDKANVLHQKLHYSVMNTIEALENKIPVLNDEEGNALLFDWAELHIYASDLSNKAGHVVSLTYVSPKLVLHEIMENLLILSYGKKCSAGETFMVKMHEDIIIKYERHEKPIYS